MNKVILYLLIILSLTQIALAASEYVVKESSVTYTDNVLLGTQNNRVAMMFPMVLLAICLISVFLDFAAVGVIVGSVATLIIGVTIGLLPISLPWLITFGTISLLFIWRMAA